MPVVNTTQARVELSAAQVIAFTNAVHVLEDTSQMPPMVYIEETNIPNTIVIGGRGIPTTLIDHQGNSTVLGKTK